VGRTNNVEKRLNQVRRSCSIDPVLVVCYPDKSSSPSLTPAKKVKCAATRRVERLIHLELEDRLGNANKLGWKCNCGVAHKEWFCGDEDVVREVIYRWGNFSKKAYGEVSH
jgi:T5orf172 domain